MHSLLYHLSSWLFHTHHRRFFARNNNHLLTPLLRPSRRRLLLLLAMVALDIVIEWVSPRTVARSSHSSSSSSTPSRNDTSLAMRPCGPPVL